MGNTDVFMNKRVHARRYRSEAARPVLAGAEGDVVEPLLQELPQADAKRRWEILTILTKLRDPRAVPMVSTFLFDAHGALKVAAAQCLGEIGDQQATGILLQALEENKDSGALIWILQALGRLRDPRAIDTLLDVMQHTESSAARYTAIEALGLIGDRKVIEPIREYLNDESHHVRSRAEVALERLGYGQTSQDPTPPDTELHSKSA